VRQCIRALLGNVFYAGELWRTHHFPIRVLYAVSVAENGRNNILTGPGIIEERFGYLRIAKLIYLSKW